VGLAPDSHSQVTPERHVALFIPHLDFGGSELQLFALARNLPPRGFRPIVVTIERRHGVAEMFQAQGIEVVALPRRGRAGLDSVLALARLIRERDIRLVHSWLWAANWRAALAGLLAPVPVVFAVRGLEDDLGLAHSLAYRPLSSRASRIIANSEAIVERSVQRTGRPDLYRIVRNGIDIAALERAAGTRAAPGAPVVGYLGSLSSRKRVESLAPIAEMVLREIPSARFLVVGGGDSRETLVAACRRLGVESSFDLAGQQADVGRWLARMTVLIHPSMSEGRSNSLLEAQALGVPVAAYDIAGNREAVLPGETGVLVRDGDERALAAAIVELLRDPARLGALAARGRAFVRERFSIDVMVDDTAEVYRAALSGAP